MRKEFFCFVVLPLLGVAVYLAILQFVPVSFWWLFFSEQGFFELAAATGFAAAGSAALVLGVTSRDVIPRHFRAYYFVIAVAGWFVALEEISYGQHLFSWSSPDWFAEHNAQGEMNLHNLGDDGLSDLLRYVANVGFPLVCVVMPLGAMWLRGEYHPSRWGYYVLPRFELVTLILTAQALTTVQHVAQGFIGREPLIRPGEMQEFYWAMAGLAYLGILWRRVGALRKEARDEPGFAATNAHSPASISRVRAA
jgi:hypothetical protein